MLCVPLVITLLTIELLLEEANVDDRCLDSMQAREQSEEEKVAMITLADACTNPGTVMIVNFDARPTVATVEGARWAQYMTSLALLDTDLLTIYVGDKLLGGVCMSTCGPSFDLLCLLVK